MQIYSKLPSPCLFPSGLLEQQAEKYAGFIHSIDFAPEQRRREMEAEEKEGGKEETNER